MMRRALRNAVSPLVMGAATTPSIASTPPTMPSHASDTFVTTVGAAAVKSAPTSAAPPSKKKYDETAAQMSATMPSVIMAP